MTIRRPTPTKENIVTKRHLTPEDYEALADSYEANPPGPDEVISIETPGRLRMGRPTAAAGKTGITPVMALRIPTEIREEVKTRVNAGESSSEAELVRTALIEYFANHPTR